MNEDFDKQHDSENPQRKFSVFEDKGGGLNLFLHSKEESGGIDYAFDYSTLPDADTLLQDILAIQNKEDFDGFGGTDEKLEELYTLFEAEMYDEGEQESALIADHIGIYPHSMQEKASALFSLSSEDISYYEELAGEFLTPEQTAELIAIAEKFEESGAVTWEDYWESHDAIMSFHEMMSSPEMQALLEKQALSYLNDAVDAHTVHKPKEPHEPPEPPKSGQPIYRFSADTALQNKEIEAFHASRNLNVECGRAIVQAIDDSNYEQYRYDFNTAAKSVIEEYGADRVAWVVAAYINDHNYDGRFSTANKTWASEFDTPGNLDFVFNTHPIVLDGFATNFRKIENELEQAKQSPAVDAKPQENDNRAQNSKTAVSTGQDKQPSELHQNPHVQELYSMLKDNGKDTAVLDTLIDCVSRLEQNVAASENQITAMKSQIDGMKEIQEHSIKHALLNTVKGLEQDVKEAKGFISEIKNSIIQGCKNAVQAVKESGIKALDNLASFFNVKAPFQNMEQYATQRIERCNKAIGKIEAFAREYHKVGMGLKNMARVLTGKERIDTPKEVGKLAAAVSAPFKAARTLAATDRNIARSAINAIDRLEERSDSIRVNQAQQKSDKADRGNNSQKKEAMADRLANAKQRADERNAERKDGQPQEQDRAKPKKEER